MKKILFLLIVFALAVFSACGNAGSNSGQGTGNNGSSSSSNQDNDASSGNGDLGGGSGSGGGYNGNIFDNKSERDEKEESKDEQYAKCGIYDTDLKKDKEEYLYKQEFKIGDNFSDIVTDAFNNKAIQSGIYKLICLYTKDESIVAENFNLNMKYSYNLYIPNEIIFQDVRLTDGYLYFYNKVRVHDNVTLDHRFGYFYDNFYADNVTIEGISYFYGGANIKNLKNDTLLEFYGNSSIDNLTNKNKGNIWLHNNAYIKNIENEDAVSLYDNSTIDNIVNNNGDVDLWGKNSNIKNIVNNGKQSYVTLGNGLTNNLTINAGYVSFDGGVIENAKVYGGELEFDGFNNKSNEGIVKSLEVYEGGTLYVRYGGTVNRAEIFSGGRIKKAYTESTITIENLIVHKGADIEVDGFTILNRQDVE